MFKKKKKIIYSEQELVPGKNIIIKLLKLQLRVSLWLTNKSERLTLQQKKLFLFCYCCLFALLSIVVVWQAFHHTDLRYLRSVVHSPPIPRHIGKPGPELLITPSKEFKSKEIERIEKFHHTMDSLNQSPAGKIIYDSIVRSMPGIMDSVLQIEKLYQIQNN